MGLKIGIVGLPNVGKSTLFNAIMGRQQALTAPYPFATVKPNVGVVDVPDERLIKLREAMFPLNQDLIRSDLSKQRSDLDNKQPPIVYSSITFVDIAGLVKGAAEGHGLGNQFLSNIRDVDVILHVVRDFETEGVPRHEDCKDPENDIKIVETELELKDLEVEEREKKDKGDKGEKKNRLMDKPVIYAINTTDPQSQSALKGLSLPGKESPYNLLRFNAKIEEEISRLPKEEQKDYLAMYGLMESGLDRIIKECYQLLGLISFLTVGKIEVKAWPARQRFAAGTAGKPVQIGPTAPEAAGVIHSDFEKLFIRAEIIGWEKMVEAGSWVIAKEKGWVRTEGRDYIVKDGDVANFLIGK